MANIHALSDSWSNFFAGVANAINDPAAISAISQFFKNGIFASGVGFKFFGIASSAYEISKLWSKGEEYIKRRLFVKIALSFLYIIHIIATSLIAASVFGVVLLTTPIATALVSLTSFVKNGSDLVKVIILIQKLNKELNALSLALKNGNISFERHKALFQDLMEFKEEIEALKKQAEVLAKEIESHKKNNKELRTPENVTSLKSSLDSRKKILQERIAISLTPQRALAKRKSFGNPTVTLDQITKLLAEANEKLEILILAKHQLEEEKKPENQINEVKKQIKEQEILIDHFGAIIQLKERQQSLQEELNKLDEKYQQSSYSSWPPERIKTFKKLDHDYLVERIESLRQRMNVLLDPDKLLKTTQEPEREQSLYGYQRSLLRQQTELRENLEKELGQINEDIKNKEALLDEKGKYLGLFADDPAQIVKAGARELYRINVDNINKQKELNLAKERRSNTIRNSLFSGSIVAFAVLLGFPRYRYAAGALGSLFFAAVGIISTIYSLWGAYQYQKKHIKLNDEQKAKIAELLKHLNAQLDVTFSVKKTPAAPSARTFLNHKRTQKKTSSQTTTEQTVKRKLDFSLGK
ncbi:MAG: hypothetical protein ACHQJ6_07805 [Candidatus Berkiellales bacterium]